MEKVRILEQRLARATAALRAEKNRVRERDQQRIFELVRRSGLTLLDVETLLSGAAKSGTESVEDKS